VFGQSRTELAHGNVGSSGALHEDNRYFNSGEKGFRSRTKYSVPPYVGIWAAAEHEVGGVDMGV
jgi:hypothetical protein